jgi:predicted RecA/RadA family phage recombinase
MADENAQLLTFTDRKFSSFKVTLAAAKSKGDIDIIQNNVAFYMEDGAIGDEVAVCISAAKAQFPKVAGTAFTAGDDLFFDDVNKELTKNNAYRPVGTCLQDAASDAETAIFDFHQEAAGTY